MRFLFGDFDQIMAADGGRGPGDADDLLAEIGQVGDKQAASFKKKLRKKSRASEAADLPERAAEEQQASSAHTGSARQPSLSQ